MGLPVGRMVRALIRVVSRPPSHLVSLDTGELRLGDLQERPDRLELDAQAVGDQAWACTDCLEPQGDRVGSRQLDERPIPFHAGQARGLRPATRQ